jgi:TolA-binding protein
MNKRILAVLVIVATVTGLSTKVQAQSLSSNQQQYTLSGDSLTGISDRTAENDFGIFFDQTQNLAGQINKNTSTGQTVQQINNPVQLQRILKPQSQTSGSELILQPAQSNTNGNDGLQLQVDVRE